MTQNGTTLFQSIEDGVKLTVPEGWVIHDVNNTGSALLEETKKGYGSTSTTLSRGRRTTTRRRRRRRRSTC